MNLHWKNSSFETAFQEAGYMDLIILTETKKDLLFKISPYFI